ncbi:protein D3 [Folsomia candida]|uniref:protein D3 n=1 Tax=Folsomia candida TaxID=158441 RepID=UPI001604D380|nr:protein D3 [Folsomia candida]
MYQLPLSLTVSCQRSQSSQHISGCHTSDMMALLLPTVFLLVAHTASSQVFNGSKAINWSAGDATSLEVKYGHVAIDNGTRMTTNQVSEPPTTVKWNADPNKFYVLAMIDPDAPAYFVPLFGETVHWMVVNIQGDDISTGEQLASYLPPSPPIGGGAHRFVFVVYEQPELKGVRIGFTFTEKFDATVRSRYRFSMRTFANTYNLGEPIAQNYFTAGWLDTPLLIGV